MKMLSKKKKGFTLIELIAVIAILAILGVILVPRIAGYTASASKSKDLTNAKQLIQAVELYNADNPVDPIASTDETTFKISNAAANTGTAPNIVVGLGKYIPAFPADPVTNISSLTDKTWTTMTITELRAYAKSLE